MGTETVLHMITGILTWMNLEDVLIVGFSQTHNKITG